MSTKQERAEKYERENDHDHEIAVASGVTSAGVFQNAGRPYYYCVACNKRFNAPQAMFYIQSSFSPNEWMDEWQRLGKETREALKKIKNP